MISTDEDAVICDFAEVYHIYDYRSLPVTYAATLACGLRDGSRTAMAMSGMKHSIELAVSAMSLDYLALLWWAKTEDGQNNRNKPKSVFNMLFGEPERKEIQTFVDGDDFMRRWNSIAKKNEA